MTITDASQTEAASRRARVVVLGEFSAGKSTLINLLTGERRLRTQVTATQLPAVWMSYGAQAPYRVDLEGNEHPIDTNDPEPISVSDTAYIRFFMKTPALELCDFIDTPGNSDPNIASAAWERVAKIADIAIWCSPCTQAWRQSELSAWRDVPERVRERSILMLTRADKLTNDEDRAKVMSRVQREAGDLFSHIHMASLKDFANAREFLRDLIDLCNSLAPEAVEQTVEPIDAAKVSLRADAEPLGRASALWQELSMDIPDDDLDAQAMAFDTFLEQPDTELDALRHELSMEKGRITRMASNLREKAQSAIDALLDHVDGCRLAVLVDLETGLVLCKNTGATIPQNLLDQIAKDASGTLETPLALSLPALGQDAKLMSVARVAKDEITVALRLTENADDALVCQFAAMPDRAVLFDAATTVFAATTEAEAA